MSFSQSISMLHINHWATQALIVVILAMILNKIFSRALTKLEKKFKKTKNIWDLAIVLALKTPLYLLVYAIAITFAAEIIYQEFNNALLFIIVSAREIAVISLIGWFLIKLIKEIQHSFNKKNTSDNKANKTAIDAITNISMAVIICTIALVILQTLGFQIGGILAIGGVGGIAIGFAAKDLLSNFFGGLMIYFDRPFEVGDWIKSPDKDIEGTVIKIGLRQTQIKTFSNRPIYVPNSVFSTIVVENPSRMTNRRIYETIGIRYDDIDKAEKIVSDVRTMLKSSKEIDQSQTIIVNVDKFAASSVDFFIYAHTVTINWVEFHQIKQDILLTISKIIENNNAEIAFPTSNIRFTKVDENSDGIMN